MKSGRKYLRDLHRIFTAGPEYEVPEADLVRLCYDAWRPGRHSCR